MIVNMLRGAHVTSFLFSAKLLAAIDARRRESADTIGFDVTRSDVVRSILERELLPRQGEEQKQKKKRARRAA